MCDVCVCMPLILALSMALFMMSVSEFLLLNVHGSEKAY